MIDQFLRTEYLFWLVVFGFYVLDNVKLVPGDRLMVRERLGGGFTALIGLSTYRIRHKDVVVPNLLMPFAMAFVLPCRPVGALDKRRAADMPGALAALRGRIGAFRAIGSIAFVALLSGPVLTYYRGLVFALLVVFPVHLLLSCVACFVLLRRREALGLGAGKAALLLFECAVVPAYLANITRRLSFRLDCPGDGYAFALGQARAGEAEELRYRIGKKIDFELDEYEPGDPRRAVYSSYRTVLGV